MLSRLLPALACASLLLVACGDDPAVESEEGTEEDAASSEGEATGVEGISVSGEVGESATITIDGDLEVTELVTEDLVEGDGAEVQPGDTVTVHYAGVLTDGTEFDASYDRGTETFPLDGVIEGWTEGIPGMRVGGRRLLVIPAEQAYGASGRPPVIPPDAALVFVVDLLEVA